MSQRTRDMESDLSDASELQINPRTEPDEAATSATTRSARHHSHAVTRGLEPTTTARPESSLPEAPAQASRTRSHSRSSVSLSATILLTSSSTPQQQRRQMSTPKRDTNSIANAVHARQSLTSSAATLRPSKQRIERNRLLSQAHVERHAQVGSDNNAHGIGDDDVDDAYCRRSDNNNNNNNNESLSRATGATGTYSHDFKADNVGRSAPAAAPASSRVRGHRAPPPTSSEPNDNHTEDAPRADPSRVASALINRPPSRQRHAFPTHLIDTNAFLSQSPPVRADSRGAATNGATRRSRDKTVHSASATLSSDTATTSERPPSRYMTKAKRNAVSSLNGATKAVLSHSPRAAGIGFEASSSTTRVLSRRCVDSVYSVNQVNHDPKTDGFADVDESVPPPFRIEITTDSYHAAPLHQSLRISSGRENQPQSTIQVSRRWSSFENQEQLLQHLTMAVGGRHHADGFGTAHAPTEMKYVLRSCLLS